MDDKELDKVTDKVNEVEKKVQDKVEEVATKATKKAEELKENIKEKVKDAEASKVVEEVKETAKKVEAKVQEKKKEVVEKKEEVKKCSTDNKKACKPCIAMKLVLLFLAIVIVASLGLVLYKGFVAKSTSLFIDAIENSYGKVNYTEINFEAKTEEEKAKDIIEYLLSVSKLEVKSFETDKKDQLAMQAKLNVLDTDILELKVKLADDKATFGYVLGDKSRTFFNKNEQIKKFMEELKNKKFVADYKRILNTKTGKKITKELVNFLEKSSKSELKFANTITRKVKLMPKEANGKEFVKAVNEAAKDEEFINELLKVTEEMAKTSEKELTEKQKEKSKEEIKKSLEKFNIEGMDKALQEIQIVYELDLLKNMVKSFVVEIPYGKITIKTNKIKENPIKLEETNVVEVKEFDDEKLTKGLIQDIFGTEKIEELLTKMSKDEKASPKAKKDIQGVLSMLKQYKWLFSSMQTGNAKLPAEN